MLLTRFFSALFLILVVCGVSFLFENKLHSFQGFRINSTAMEYEKGKRGLGIKDLSELRVSPSCGISVVAQSKLQCTVSKHPIHYSWMHHRMWPIRIGHTFFPSIYNYYLYRLNLRSSCLHGMRVAPLPS